MADLRVTFLTHYFPPEVGAAQTRIAALARGLQHRGVRVAIHTGFPNYPDGRVQPPYRNRPLLRERSEDGLRVVRSAVLPAPNAGFVRRLANHTAFAGSCLATAAATGPQHVVVVEAKPLFIGGAGVLYARAKRAPMVAHVSDLWPMSAVQLGVLEPGAAVRAAERLESWIYRSAAAVTVPTRGMVGTLQAHADAAGKVHRMPPCVDVGRFAATAVPERNGPLRLLYAGTVGLAQGIGTLIDAVAHAGPEVAELTIAGWGRDGEHARRRIADHAATNVRMLGTVAPETVVDLYERTHVGVVLLKDRPIFAGALPTKLYESMAAGRPVLLSARGEAAEAVAAAGAGEVVGPEDAGALEHAIRRLHAADHAALAELGARGRRHVEQEASLEGSVSRWLALLQTAAGEAKARAGTPRRPASAVR